MKKQVSTNENINRLIEFRQALYAHVFLARRDALFETLDALLAGGTFASFAYLSQSERFRRRWPSLYQAVEDGRIDSEAFRRLVAAQLPRNGVCVFPLDSSAWPRPRSRVLQDTQYVYQASSAVNGGTVTIGYPCSLLEWCAEAHSGWSLPVDVRRISSRETAQAVGAAQIRSLAQVRQDCVEARERRARPARPGKNVLVATCPDASGKRPAAQSGLVSLAATNTDTGFGLGDRPNPLGSLCQPLAD